MSPQGRFPTAEVERIVRQALSGALGAANMQDRALGVGDPSKPGLAGKHNAYWARVKLTATSDLTNVEVPHALGEVPVLCTLWEWSNATTPDVFFQARPILKDKWTKTTCRVALFKTGTGAQAGSELVFKVEGS